MTTKYTTLDLTVFAGGIYNATNANFITSENMQTVIFLYHGLTIPCKVYSETNICFDVNSDILQKQWKRKKDFHWKITKERLEKTIAYFKNISCSLPNRHIKQSPSEIKDLLNRKYITQCPECHMKFKTNSKYCKCPNCEWEFVEQNFYYIEPVTSVVLEETENTELSEYYLNR